jgi:hypothetical protein
MSEAATGEEQLGDGEQQVRDADLRPAVVRDLAQRDQEAGHLVLDLGCHLVQIVVGQQVVPLVLV